MLKVNNKDTRKMANLVYNMVFSDGLEHRDKLLRKF